MSWKCNQCGAENEGKFCTICGTQYIAPEPPQKEEPVQYEEPVNYQEPVQEPARYEEPVKYSAPVQQEAPAPQKPKKKGKKIAVIAIIAVLLIGCAVGLVSCLGGGETYIVTFDANGGTGTPPAQTVEEGEFAVEPTEIPVREGYIFEGWTAVKDQNVIVDFKTMAIGADITLYAYWTEEAPKTVVLPDLSGKTLEEAEAELTKLGLVPEKSDVSDYNNKIKKDCVVKTEPAAGTEVEIGSTVKIELSKGTKPNTTTKSNSNNSPYGDVPEYSDVDGYYDDEVPMYSDVDYDDYASDSSL